jgi:tetratricopeptide (TPR) repeat protein
MNIFTTMLIGAAGLLSAPITAPEHALSQVSTPPVMEAPCCQEELVRARELHETGQWKEAHRAYLKVAELQGGAGEFAGEALWEAAQLSAGQGRYLRAAQELDRVVKVAADFGRPSLQARALFEAAVLYHRYVGGRDHLAHERLVQLERILSSPDVSEEVKELVEGRIRSTGTVS